VATRLAQRNKENKNDRFNLTVREKDKKNAEN
jgi:hypothetical protein